MKKTRLQTVKDPDHYLERKYAAQWLRGVAKTIASGKKDELVKIKVEALIRTKEEIIASFLKQEKNGK